MEATEPEVAMPILQVQGNVVRGQPVGCGELMEVLAIPSISALIRSGKPMVATPHLAHVLWLIARGVGPGHARLRQGKRRENTIHLAVELPARLQPERAIAVEIGSDRVGGKTDRMFGPLKGLSIPFHQGRTAPHAFFSRYQPEVAFWPNGQAGHPITDQAVLRMEVPQLLPIPHHGAAAYRPQPQVAIGVLDGPQRIIRDLQLGRGVHLHLHPWPRAFRHRLGSHLTSTDQQ